MEQLSTVITIKSITPRPIESLNTTVFSVETMEGEKYQFWQYKKDRSETVAFQQYTKLRFLAGDVLEIKYSESEGKPYLNKHTNKMVTPMNKTITFFSKEDDYTPKRVQPIQEKLTDDRIGIIIENTDKILSILEGQKNKVAEVSLPTIDIAEEIPTPKEDDGFDMDSIPF